MGRKIKRTRGRLAHEIFMTQEPVTISEGQQALIMLNVKANRKTSKKEIT